MDFDKYVSGLNYPQRPEKPKLKVDATPDEIRLYADDTQCYLNQKNLYHKALHECRADQSKLNAIFREDCLEDLGIQHNLKADKAWEMAYERGHSAGFSEIYNYLIDLAELIRE